MEALNLNPVYGHYIGGPKKAGETRILRNILIKENEDLKKDVDGMLNFKDIFEARAREVPEKPFLGGRRRIVDANTKEHTFGDYEWKTFGETYKESQALAYYLIKNDLCPVNTSADGKFRFVALFSKNRVEWATSDFACILSGITSVCLYDTLGKESTDYILD
jgi:long-chain acyl-CoA synthetase